MLNVDFDSLPKEVQDIINLKTRQFSKQTREARKKIFDAQAPTPEKRQAFYDKIQDRFQHRDEIKQARKERQDMIKRDKVVYDQVERPDHAIKRKANEQRRSELQSKFFESLNDPNIDSSKLRDQLLHGEHSVDDEEDEQEDQEEVAEKQEKPKGGPREIKKDGIWDFGIEDEIPYFDITCSYELTGYRPINETEGLDFDPNWFTEARANYLKTGKYIEAPRGTMAYDNFWSQEYDRLCNGMESHGYRITGDNYYFLNYYRMLVTDDVEYAGQGRSENFPSFYVAQYEYFHYVELCKKLSKNVVALKGRALGFSEIAAGIVTNTFESRPQTRSLVVAYLDQYLDRTLAKVWDQINFGNRKTDGGLFKPLGIDQPRKKKSFVEELRTKVEKGWLSEIEGIIANTPNKVRGDRTEIIFFEEAGSFKDLKKAFIQGESLTTIGGKKIGISIAFGCVCAGTKIWTADGRYINIEDLNLGDKVIGFNGDKSSIETVVYLPEPRKKHCYEITTTNGSLRCSYDHPLMTLEPRTTKKYRSATVTRAEDLKVGDYLIVKGNDVFGEINEPDAYALGISSIDIPQSIGSWNKNSVLSFLAGYIDKNGEAIIKNNGNVVIFIKSDNYDKLDFIKALFLKLGIVSSIVKRNNGYILKITNQQDISLIVNSKKLKGVSIVNSRNRYKTLKFNLNPKNNKGQYFVGKELHNVAVAKIKKIQDIGDQNIYNLTANTTHTYISNGFVSLNTGGDAGPALEGLKDMFYKPETYLVLPFKNIYCGDGSSLTGFFIPSYRIVTSCMDKRGYTTFDDGKAYYNEIRKRFVNDPQGLIIECAEHCFTPEEAFVLEGENQFNRELLVEQLTRIRQFKEGPQIERGVLDYDFRGREHVESNIAGVKFIPSKTAKLQILERPLVDASGQPFKNLYVAGIDAIDLGQDETSEAYKDPSQFCMVVMRRAHGTKPPQIVAIYKDRPQKVREAYKQALLLCEWYNCKTLLENTKISVRQYFEERKRAVRFLMRRPQATLTTSGVGSRQWGAPATEVVIHHQLDLIAQYIEDYCDQIWFDEVLDECIHYSYTNKRKFDIVAALGMMFLADEELTGMVAAPQEDQSNSWHDIGYYTDPVTGYKRYGIIPDAQPSIKAKINVDHDYSGIRSSDPRDY